MSLTLLALFMLPLLLKMVLDPTGMHQVLKDWSKSPVLQWMSAILPLMMALLIFSTSPISFTWSWSSLLSWMGVLMGLKGISHLFPGLIAWKIKWVTEERLPIFGVVGLLLLLGMVYIDSQLL